MSATDQRCKQANTIDDGGPGHAFRVRLLGPPFPLVFALAGHKPTDAPGHDGLPYGDATVAAQPWESLATVMNRAAVRLGVSHLQGGNVGQELTWIRFHESERDRFAYDDRLLWAQELSVIDAAGHVHLGRRLEQVTVAELLRTAEIGLLDGDPLQPYLVPTLTQGGVEPWALDWAALIGHLQLLLTAMGAVTTVDGTISIARRLYTRLRGATTAVAEQQRRGGTPELLWDLLQHRPVSPDDVAAWLRCSTEDARTLMLTCGLDDRGDGLWEAGATEDARIMRDVLLEIRDRWSLDSDSTNQVLMTRLEHLVETGTRLPAPDPYAWEAQVADQPDLDDELDDLDEHDRDTHVVGALPLADLRLVCACEDETCRCLGQIGFAGSDLLRIDLAEPTDHFELQAGFLEAVLEQHTGE